MNRQTIGGSTSNLTLNGENSIQQLEFTMMTDKLTKPILVMLLKKYTLYIETYSKQLYIGTYKNIKLIGKTKSDVILIYDLLSENEVTINLEDIKIVRVFK